MNVYIFSSSINNLKILLKSIHNIESVLSSSIFLSHKLSIFNPPSIDLARFQDMLQKAASKQERHVMVRIQR